MTASNAAMRYNLANAVTGVYPDYTIDYPRGKGDQECYLSFANANGSVCSDSQSAKDNTIVNIITSILNVIIPNFKKGGGSF